MKLLVLTAFYPVPNGTRERMFVHVRNRYYARGGLDVTVLNFDARQGYEIDGIRVITQSDFENMPDKGAFDVAISHSANLRNHYRFLKKYEKHFRRLVFFFHGHEVLYLNRDYPKPYPYMTGSKWHRRLAQDVYDWLKIHLWARYYESLAPKSEFVFVSRWVLDHFKKNSGLDERRLANRCHIINNSIGEAFEKRSRDPAADKRYDFITIRSNLDGSKYCVDLVVRFARSNPDCSFLLIGKGRFFDHNEKPGNMKWISDTISHEDILQYLDASRCALMPTREDTQGVMACEMITYGIPLITSDIDVCHEFFEGRPGVRLISNEDAGADIAAISRALAGDLPLAKERAWFAENTIKREIDLINEGQKV